MWLIDSPWVRALLRRAASSSRLLPRGEALQPGRVVVLCSAVFLALFVPAFAFLRHVERAHAEVEVSVDALVSSGSVMRLFVNEEWSFPFDLSVTPGKRQQYVFRGVPGFIHALRLDPSDRQGATIELHGLQVRSGGNVLASYSGADTASWGSANVRVVSVDGGRAVLLAVTDDPMLVSRVDVPAKSKGHALAGVERFARPLVHAMPASQTYMMLLMLLLIPIVFALTRATDHVWQTAWLVLSLVMGYWSSSLALRLSMTLGGGELPSVERAVGRAAYTGLEKNLDFRGFFFAVVAAALVAAGFALAWGRIRRGTMADGPHACEAPGSSRFAIPALVTAIIAFACVNFPDVVHLQSVETMASTQWDAQNLATWSYFRKLGLMPFRDFWYCYGGFHFMQLPYSPDVFYRWGHSVLVFSACAVGLLFLADLRVKRSLLVLAFGCWLGASGFLVGWDRYLTGFGAMLLWAAALHRDDRRLALAAGGYTGYVFFIEPNQVLYMAPAVLLLLAAAMYERPRARWRALLGKVGAGCLVAAVAVSIYLVMLWRGGALEEFVLFYATMSDMAKYSMHPAAVADWFWTLGNENLLLSLTLVLIMVSAWSISLRRRESMVKAAVPAAVALLTIMLFQKQLTRPHVAQQITGIPAVGIALALLLPLRGPLSLRAKAVAWGCAGIAASIILSGHAVAREIVRRDVARMASVGGDIAAAFDAKAWGEARDRFMMPSRFVIDDVRGTELRAGLLAKMSFEKEDDLYVLGDDSYLYILLGQRAPFYITQYNSSILYSQEHIVTWLREHRPKYVLWRSDHRDFDEVPNVTRTPLIFAEVLGSYSPVVAFGNYTIMQRKSGNHLVDFGFWRDRLGGVFDLGYIASRSDPFAEQSAGPGAVRYDVLSVTVQRPVAGRARELAFDLGQPGKLSLRFLERKGTSRYNVVLDRVWFWHLAKAAGVMPALETPRDDGVSAKVASLDAVHPLLY